MTKLQFTNADTIKLALLMVYRFSRGAYLVSTECGNYSSDVMAVEKDGTITEIEVKVSLTDFKADFKKDKHKIFEHASTLKESAWDKKFMFVPHYFYFAIPESLVTDVLPLLMGKPYGVISVPDIEFKPSLHWVQNNKYLKVVKRPSALRLHKITEQERKIIISRMSSEMINAKAKLITRNKVHEETKESEEA